MMHGRDGRFSQLRWLQNLVCVAGMVGAVALIWLGLVGYGSSVTVWMVAAGSFVFFAAIVILTVVPLLLKMESTARRQLDELRDMQEVVSKQGALLESIAHSARISDTARSLTNREEELEALRGTFRKAVRNDQWDHALELVAEIERRPGCREEADGLRRELHHAKDDAIQHRLTEAIELIRSHFESHEWNLAQSEIDRLQQALPGEPKVAGLQERVESLKGQHKEELKLAWDQAVRRSDTDQAIDVLKELDQYLSPAEAHALRESARNVFKEKLLQLGVQFRFAVGEKRWQDALSSGLELLREFPNARMANEVREVLDALRDRARQAEVPLPAGMSPPNASMTRAD